MKEDKLNIIQKLILIRQGMGYFKKKTPGQYTDFVGISDILTRVTELMDEYNVLLIANVIDSTLVKIDKNFISSQKWKMVWVNGDDPKDREEVFWFGDGSNMQSASFAGGGALTYNTRYFMLMQFNCITGTDDPEIKNNKDLNSQKKKKASKNVPQNNKLSVDDDKVRYDKIDELFKIMKAKGIKDKEIKDCYGVTKLYDLTMEQVDAALVIAENELPRNIS